MFLNFAEGTDFSTALIQDQAISFVSNPTILVVAVVLIVITLLLIFFLRRIIVNTVLGLLIWGAATYIFKIQLPLLPSFVVSAVFGPAGIGVILLLKFLGVM